MDVALINVNCEKSDGTICLMYLIVVRRTFNSVLSDIEYFYSSSVQIQSLSAAVQLDFLSYILRFHLRSHHPW